MSAPVVNEPGVSAPSAPWRELTLDRRIALAIDDVEPSVFARPATAEALADTLRQADAAGLAVAPRGGGSHTWLGNRPARLDLVLDTTALDQVVEYEPADLTVTVQAGMRFEALQALLRAQGQFLALDPPPHAGSTIGGLIATNLSGPLRLGYGTARDLVIGIRVANPDGALTKAGGRVVKNVAGYDLDKLYVGSLGTVGVIVELSFKLAPIPPSEGVVAIHLAGTEQAHLFTQALVQSNLGPLAVEALGGAAAGHLGLPEQGSTVVVRVGGYEPAVQRQVREIAALAGPFEGRRVDAPDDAWDGVLRLSQAPGRDVLLKAAVPIAQWAAAAERLQAAFPDLRPLTWAHAGSGIVYSLFKAPDDLAALGASLLSLRTVVRALGSSASLVVQRCPAALKASLDVWGDPGDGLPVMRALKARLDPHNTLNPGRYVGGI